MAQEAVASAVREGVISIRSRDRLPDGSGLPCLTLPDDPLERAINPTRDLLVGRPQTCRAVSSSIWQSSRNVEIA